MYTFTFYGAGGSGDKHIAHLCSYTSRCQSPKWIPNSVINCFLVDTWIKAYSEINESLYISNNTEYRFWKMKKCFYYIVMYLNLTSQNNITLYFQSTACSFCHQVIHTFDILKLIHEVSQLCLSEHVNPTKGFSIDRTARLILENYAWVNGWWVIDIEESSVVLEKIETQ